MRLVTLLSAALCVTLLAAGEAWGQAGRFPIRFPSGGGGGFHVPIHFPWHGSGGDSDLFWVIVAIVGILVLAVVGWKLGEWLGRAKSSASSSGQTLNGLGSLGQSAATPPPPLEDLILRPDEVEEKARKTTRLLDALAQRDAAFNPLALRAFISATFTRVQQCWEARDYGPVRELLGPTLLAQHEELLKAMRRSRQINRIDDLRIRRLEFVHLWCPQETDRQEVTALITFEAKVYFVHERTGAFLHGSHKILPYQEFWIFRRYGEGWRLQVIDRSHESDRLEAANRVDGMTEVDRRNTEEGVIVL
jgi:predicted lipid-binding transport protein (Tim44 family)